MILKESWQWRGKLNSIEVIYNKTISSQARLCDSIPSISYFTLSFWIKASLRASWHICSLGYMKELFCETLETLLEVTVCSYITCFPVIPITFAVRELFPPWKMNNYCFLPITELGNAGRWISSPCTTCPIVSQDTVTSPSWYGLTNILPAPHCTLDRIFIVSCIIPL